MKLAVPWRAFDSGSCTLHVSAVRSSRIQCKMVKVTAGGLKRPTSSVISWEIPSLEAWNLRWLLICPKPSSFVERPLTMVDATRALLDELMGASLLLARLAMHKAACPADRATAHACARTRLQGRSATCR